MFSNTPFHIMYIFGWTTRKSDFHHKKKANQIQHLFQMDLPNQKLLTSPELQTNSQHCGTKKNPTKRVNWSFNKFWKKNITPKKLGYFGNFNDLSTKVGLLLIFQHYAKIFSIYFFSMATNGSPRCPKTTLGVNSSLLASTVGLPLSSATEGHWSAGIFLFGCNNSCYVYMEDITNWIHGKKMSCLCLWIHVFFSDWCCVYWCYVICISVHSDVSVTIHWWIQKWNSNRVLPRLAAIRNSTL